MGRRGGRTRTTMPKVSSWNSGKTKMIRVPIKLASEIITFARYLDNGIDPAERAIIEFELLKQKQYRRTKRRFDRSSPRWSVFNEFQWWLKSDLSKW